MTRNEKLVWAAAFAAACVGGEDGFAAAATAVVRLRTKNYWALATHNEVSDMLEEMRRDA